MTRTTAAATKSRLHNTQEAKYNPVSTPPTEVACAEATITTDELASFVLLTALTDQVLRTVQHPHATHTSRMSRHTLRTPVPTLND